MLELARRARDDRPPHLQFMPGGSPMFQSAAQIDRLYESLEILFEEIARWCRGMTLAEFRDHWVNTQELAPALVGREPAGVAANEDSMVPG